MASSTSAKTSCGSTAASSDQIPVFKRNRSKLVFLVDVEGGFHDAIKIFTCTKLCHKEALRVSSSLKLWTKQTAQVPASNPPRWPPPTLKCIISLDLRLCPEHAKLYLVPGSVARGRAGALPLQSSQPSLSLNKAITSSAFFSFHIFMG